MKFKSEHLMLYAITNSNALKNGESMETAVDAALRGGVSFLQLREKNVSQNKYIEIAKSIRPIAEKYGVPFVINDDVDVALAVDADGVHLGMSDCEIGQARLRMGKDKIIGATAKTVKQAINAEKAGASYLGIGACFETSTKQDAILTSWKTLKEIIQSVKIPVVLIGGITLENVVHLKDIGANGFAVSSAIFRSDDIFDATCKLKNTVIRMR